MRNVAASSLSLRVSAVTRGPAISSAAPRSGQLRSCPQRCGGRGVRSPRLYTATSLIGITENAGYCCRDDIYHELTSLW